MPTDGRPVITQAWVIIHRPTKNIVGEYDNREEAEDAVKWYEKTFGGGKLEVVRGN